MQNDEILVILRNAVEVCYKKIMSERIKKGIKEAKKRK